MLGTRLIRLTAITLVTGLPSLAAFAQTTPARERYTKHELYIPMRDGVRLFTIVYTPKDTSKIYPILLQRTPYSIGPYGADRYGIRAPAARYVDEGFIFAFQDVRGCYMSEGEFVNVRPQRKSYRGPKNIDESTDTWDTVDWLVKCIPNNNGRVGMWGISYPGFYAAAGVINSHPALKAVSPQAPIADWFVGDDFHHNGAFFLMDAFDFLSGFGGVREKPSSSKAGVFNRGATDAYSFFLNLGPLSNADAKHFQGRVPFWNEMMANGHYNTYWKDRNLLPHLKGVTTAVMTVGGLFDAEDLYGPPAIYRAIEKQNPGIHNTLVLGPWFHGTWSAGSGNTLGDIKFGSSTSEYYREQIEYPFFNGLLKGTGDFKQPEAQVFTTGSNQWAAYDAWPPANTVLKSLYLAEGKALNWSAAPDRPTKPSSYDSYVSDPSNPVPYIGASANRRRNDYMLADQRFAEKRGDVLTYRTPPLAEEVRVAGPIEAELFVSLDTTDADFVVKLIDEYPADSEETNSAGASMAGYQMLVRAEILRGKFRDSFEKPRPFRPGQVTRVRVPLRDASHTFRKGHRIVVQIQSSWFPLADRNPQVFTDIYRARAEDFRKATILVHRGGNTASRVVVRVIEVGEEERWRP